MTPAERAAPTPKRCVQCRTRWAVATIFRAGKRQPTCAECIEARKKAESRNG